MIGILDYGLGNIKAFTNVFKSFDISYKVINKEEDLKKIQKLILPGVGAFDDAMKKFNDSGLRDKVELMVKKDKIPILGICVGLHQLKKVKKVLRKDWVGLMQKLKNLI